jgi:hypothetical protein
MQEYINRKNPEENNLLFVTIFASIVVETNAASSRIANITNMESKIMTSAVFVTTGTTKTFAYSFYFW